MAAGTQPIFIATPKHWQAVVSVANALRDGTGTVVTLATGGANGSRIDRIEMRAIVATTAGMVRLFVDDLTNKRAWKEVLVAAITPSATLDAWSGELVRADGQPLLLLPSGWLLIAATEKAEAIHLHASGGDY